MVNYAIISAAAAAILSSAASVVNAVPIPDNNSYDSGSSSSYTSTATSTASSYAASSTGSSYNGGSSYGGSSSSSYNGGSSSYNGGSYSTPMYGSGSSSWSMQSSYDSCVEQCIATYGSATVGSYDMSNTTMSSYDSSSYSGSSSDCSGGDCSSSSCSGSDCGSSSSCSGGSCGGMTHTVMVAPTQGVLRYVPFALNASVGDTIKYVWGGNNHTVSLGSQLDLCNSSSNSTASNFTSSGEHGMNFEYSVMINDTAPMYMYCATPGHCEKGMFMIINPIMSNSSSYNMSAGNMIASMSNSTNSSIAYMQTMYSRQSGANSSMAANWGAGMNVSAVPAWAYESFMENVMYTRTFLAANNDLLNTDGSVNISKSAHPIVVPQDVTRAILNVAPAAPAAKQNKRDLDVETQEQDVDFDEDSEDDAEDEEDDSVLESAVPVQTFKMAKRHSGARSTAAVSVLGSIVVLSVAALTAL